LYDDTQSDGDDDNLADFLEVILGRVGQHQDANYDDDGVDVSVGVDVGAVVGVGVNGHIEIRSQNEETSNLRRSHKIEKQGGKEMAIISEAPPLAAPQLPFALSMRV